MSRWSGVTNEQVALLLDELSEPPLPGARYARDVVRRRLPAIEAEARAAVLADLLAEVQGMTGAFNPVHDDYRNPADTFALVIRAAVLAAIERRMK